jgi:hypothetical protein
MERPEEPTMSSLTSNPTAALMMADRMIAERVRDAHDRARGDAVRADRRAARRSRRLTAAPPKHQFDLPWWVFRSLRSA